MPAIHNQDGTLTQAVVDYVRSHPGAKRSEIIEGIGYEGPPMTITSTLARLKRMHVLKDRGGAPKHRRWDVVEVQAVSASIKLAEDILRQLREIHPSARAPYLAQKLEDLLGKAIEEEDEYWR